MEPIEMPDSWHNQFVGLKIPSGHCFRMSKTALTDSIMCVANYAIDIGDGIGWISGVPSTTSLSVEDVNYTLSQNATGSTRIAQIQVIDNINNPSFTIRQIAGGLNNITMDSTSITFDNNNITMDNG